MNEKQNMEEKEINKILKPNYKLFLITFLMLIIGFLLLDYSLTEDNINMEDAQSYNTLIANKEDSSSLQYAKAEIIYMNKFAYKDNLNFYIGMDENDWFYIFRITDSTYEQIKKEAENDPDDFVYEIYGFTHKIDDDVKKLAIERLNEILTSDFKITKDNYEEYLGNSYLDETMSSNSYLKSLCVGVGIVLMLSSIVLNILIIIKIFKTKKSLKNNSMDNLYYELKEPTTQIFKKQHIYLTNKHIVSTLNGLKILNYEDIYWLYKEERKINGIPIGTYLNARLTNKKAISISYSNVHFEILDDVINNILLKNNKILIGFTKENKKKFNEYKKII